MLFSWEDVVADASENELRSANYQFNHKGVTDAYIRRADYRRLYFSEIGESEFESNYNALLSDPKFEDYLAERYVYKADATAELKIVRENNIKIT